MSITRLNPETSTKAGISQVAVVDASAKRCSSAVRTRGCRGKVVGTDVGSQSAQAYKNVITALEAAGAGLTIDQVNVYLVRGSRCSTTSTRHSRASRPRRYRHGDRGGGAGKSRLLIEIDAIAAVSGG